jgi:uncharacterized protein YndB with AHSA1/START domain
MFNAEHTVTINRAPNEVFAYVSDPTRLHEWRPNVLEVIGYEPPVRAGSTYELAEKFMGRRMQVGQRVVAYEPDRHIEIETTSGSVLPRQHYSFEPTADGGTRYTVRLEMRTQGFMRIFEPLMRGQVRKMMATYSENLKRNVESVPQGGEASTASVAP